MASGSRYSRDDVERAAATWFATGSDVKTAEITGLPRATVCQWRNGRSQHWSEIWHETLLKLHHEKKGEIAARLSNYALSAVDRAFACIGDMSGKDAMITLGIAVEKLQLLLNQPTSITGKVGEVERLAEQAERIRNLDRKSRPMSEERVTH